MKMRKYTWLLSLIIVVAVAISCFVAQSENSDRNASISIDDLPAFSDKPYVVVNNNIPEFQEDEITGNTYECYSELDALNRCGYAIACIGIDGMPTEERGSIGQVKPSGWQTVKYDVVDGKYLYNRCHLIGYQLTGENANECNLITGTRYLNVEGMLPFENMVADYVKETGKHVMYRVTPVFSGNELVARGVQIEALSVEDDGAGISFNIYAYNNQPGVTIDYATGDSTLMEEDNAENAPQNSDGITYILNLNSKRFHLPSCGQGINITEENKERYNGNRSSLIDDGYVPAGCCNP